MKLTVIGKSPVTPDPGSACSGYLLQQGATRVLLDCGTGVLARLGQHMDFTALDGVVISHMHADHCIDLLPLAYGLNSRRAKLPLWLPPGGRRALAAVADALDGRPGWIETAYDIAEYDPAGELAVGDLSFRFTLVPHYNVPSWAVRVSGNGSRLTYSGDSAPSEALVRLAQGSDLFLCEAGLMSAADDPPGLRGHLTPEEAGHLARQAGVRRLLLTHFSVRSADPDRRRALAVQAFGREDVGLAREDLSVDI